jgi:ribose 5-phosphate isomerase B
MKYVIGTDHAGLTMKNFVRELLEKMGHEVEDLGPFSTDRVDYPDYAKKVADKILELSGNIDENLDWQKTGIYGILICGTGIGMSVTANKIIGIRATLCHDSYTAEMSRAHNNANILCFGARTTGEGTVESIISAWNSTKFEGGRHLQRVKKINLIEKLEKKL